MSHNDSVKILASLFRAHNEARPVLLLGAGASFSSGVPLADQSVPRIARRVYAEKVKGGSVLPEQVKLSEWQTWLQAHDWYISGETKLAENFPRVVRHLLHPREYRARILRELFQPSAGIGEGYRSVASLVMRGLIRTVLTANFDLALPIALGELKPHLSHIAEVNRVRGNVDEFSQYSRAQIVWLHGKAEQYSDQNTADEVEKLDKKLIEKLVPMLADAPLIVIGYRGAEPSIVDHLLRKNARRANQYRNGIFWCLRKGETLHPNVEALKKAVGDNFRQLEIDGFDEVMRGVVQELVGEDLYSKAQPIAGDRNAACFDDRPVEDASIADLDHDLMLTVMREYCEKLERAPVTAETLPGLLREQGFLVKTDNLERPTNGCILLFGREPQRYFSHAVISATFAGKKRVLFEGNLIQQYRNVLDWLGADEVNPKLKVKRGSKHEEKSAFAARALVELLVNMLVHRDYERADTASIDVEPGVGITFENPGGLLDSVVQKLTIDGAGNFKAVARVSDLRNRSLCDVFFGIRAMEREGTGLLDVEELSRESGGQASFRNDAKSAQFLARISQPVSSAGSKTVARDSRPLGVYVLNALPFASLPSHLSVIGLTGKIPRSVDLSEAGTFIILRDDVLLSFTPLAILVSILGDVVDHSITRSAPIAEYEADPDLRRRLSWLLRKHFERHLRKFEDRGLVLEDRKSGRRAYFQGRDGRPRKLTYDSPRRKGIAREVVKQRAEEPNRWFENEGFGYEVIQLDGTWAVRIKPTYIFTGRDARKLLPAFARTARATRRIKFDRNKNVDDDLTFWARWLSDGSPTINIGQQHVSDLILEGSFLTIEVPEEGLLKDAHESEDRMSA